MMAIVPEPAGAMERPPKPKAHRPEQVKELCGVGAVGVGTELARGGGVDTRLHQKEQLAGAFETLPNAFQRQQAAIDGQDPEEPSEPRRKQRAGAWCVVRRPLRRGL